MRGSFCPTDQVETGCYDMGHLPTAGQVLADGHFEEVEGGVQTVFVELQLDSQIMDLSLSIL